MCHGIKKYFSIIYILNDDDQYPYFDRKHCAKFDYYFSMSSTNYIINKNILLKCHDCDRTVPIDDSTFVPQHLL